MWDWDVKRVWWVAKQKRKKRALFILPFSIFNLPNLLPCCKNAHEKSLFAIKDDRKIRFRPFCVFCISVTKTVTLVAMHLQLRGKMNSQHMLSSWSSIQQACWHSCNIEEINQSHEERYVCFALMLPCNFPEIHSFYQLNKLQRNITKTPFLNDICTKKGNNETLIHGHRCIEVDACLPVCLCLSFCQMHRDTISRYQTVLPLSPSDTFHCNIYPFSCNNG